MKNFIFCLILLAGCSQRIQTKTYAVVSSFNETIMETDEKARAYETAHNLTMMGRALSSKPCYFVLEKKGK